MIRILLVCLCLPILAGCSGSAAGLGLTGAPQAIPPTPPSDADIGAPGIAPATGPYTPSLVPSTGGGRYFGYDD